MTTDSSISAELLQEKLSSIDGISTKRMFGGHGIFHENKMFGLIDSKGHAFLKIDEQTQLKFEKEGSTRHSKMPYFSIPKAVFNDVDELNKWAHEAIKRSKK